MKHYCPSCEKECTTKVVEQNETLKVKGQDITLKVKVRICEKCGEEIIDKELDNESLKAFYEEYKKINNLLTTAEIKEIRNQWGLSQSQFALLLGMGEKTITRYENGNIQDETHDNLIRLARETESFRTLWDVRKDKLDRKTQNKVLSILEEKEKVNNYTFTSIAQEQQFNYSMEGFPLFSLHLRRQRNAEQKYGA